MEDKDTEFVTLTKEINLQDLAQGAEFQIDVDFKGKKNKNDLMLMDDEDLMKQESTDDSDTEEVLRNIERDAELSSLSSPEYTSFDDLATKMVDCLPSGEVKMLIVEEGTGPLVPPDAEVTLHYAAYWEKERLPFDCTLSNNRGQPQTFRLGTGSLLTGLEVGLSLVRGPAASLHLLVAPKLAWGEFGVPPRIRPERCLFTVSLLAVKDVAAIEHFNELPSKEQKSFQTTDKFVTASNQKAKEFYKRKLYRKALNTYLKSLSVIEMSCPENDEQNEQIINMKKIVYLNLAVCYSKLNVPNKVFLMLGYLSRITDMDKHAKGLYYYGKAYTMLGEYSDAEKYYKKALNLEPKNPEIGNAMAELDALIKKADKTEKELWKSAFSNKKEEEKELDVDEDFVENIKVTCKDLCERTEYTKFDLPQGLTKIEVQCIRDVVSSFEGLSVSEDGEGRKKKISLIKVV